MKTLTKPAACLLAFAVTQHATVHADVTSVDLSTYIRVGRYDLPEPTRTSHPANSLLAQEASAVTYNRDTNTLFVVGDGGTSIVQVSKTGQLINSMTFSLQDTEGVTWVGNGKFVIAEERLRQVDLFTYVPNTILNPATIQSVKLGTTVGNDGMEGISLDPFSSGFVAIRETNPQGIYQTTINFTAGTASNGSFSTLTPANLFNPSLLGLGDLADIYSLSNLPSLTGQEDYSHLLLLSQESGKILETDRSGNILSSLTLISDPGNPLTISQQHHEGLTMDDQGFLYVVSEGGGGDSNHPQLWVFAPGQSTPAPEPTSLALLALGSLLLLRRRT